MDLSKRPFVRFVTRKWPPAVGGMETYSVELTEHLRERCDLEVMALPGRANGAAPGPVQLVVFGLRSFASLLFARRPADVTHAGDLACWPLAWAARLRAPGSRVVVSAHGTDVSFALRKGSFNRIYRGYLALGRRLLRSATVIANSRATAEALGMLGFHQVPVVPLAAPMGMATPPPRPEPHLLFAGRLVRRKGLSWFVSEVLDTLPGSLTLHVAGPVWDDAEAACLSHPRVLHLGALSPDALRRAYARALCVVIPNREESVGHLEGFGLVAPEAAAAGAVVLGSRTGGLSDAILDNETGFLLPPGDAEAWKSKIVEVSQWGSETRGIFVAEAMAKCRAHFSWDRVARETLALYLR